MAEEVKLKKDFLNLLLKKKALRIAENSDNLIQLKSGRKSTFFCNFGDLSDGESASMVKKAYATFIYSLLKEKKLEEFDFIFGPAYKGINLACLACEGLYELYGINKKYLYDRKEEKGHGITAEKTIVGASSFKQGQKILMIDDVITTGKAKIDALEKLKTLGDHKVVGLVIALDRQDKTGDVVSIGKHSAVQEMEINFGMKVYSFMTMQDIFAELKNSLPPEIKNAWIEYYNKYGIVKVS